MRSWNGNALRIAALLQGESTRGPPSQRPGNAALGCYPQCTPQKLLNKQSICLWFETHEHSCDVTVMTFLMSGVLTLAWRIHRCRSHVGWQRPDGGPSCLQPGEPQKQYRWGPDARAYQAALAVSASSRRTERACRGPWIHPEPRSASVPVGWKSHAGSQGCHRKRKRVPARCQTYAGRGSHWVRKSRGQRTAKPMGHQIQTFFIV